jgi:putative transposase
MPDWPGGSLATSDADAIIAVRGVRPLLCVSDNGTELTSNAVQAWCQDSKVGWHYIAPASRRRTPSRKASSADYAMNA